MIIWSSVARCFGPTFLRNSQRHTPNSPNRVFCVGRGTDFSTPPPNSRENRHRLVPGSISGRIQSAGDGDGFFVAQRRESSSGAVRRPRRLLSTALSPPSRPRSLPPRYLRSRPRRRSRLLRRSPLPIPHQVSSSPLNFCSILNF